MFLIISQRPQGLPVEEKSRISRSRCEHVKRLLLVRRRNTIHVTLAAPFIFLGRGGWELCFNWGTFKEGLVHGGRIQLTPDQPTRAWVQVPRRSLDGARATAGTNRLMKVPGRSRREDTEE